MKKQTNKAHIQQGDCLFRRIPSMPDGEQKVVASKRIVVAHGESGHSHVIEDDEAELIRIGDRMLLKLEKASTLTHEEHAHITLEPGIYEIGRVQEFDYLSMLARPVVD